MMSKLNNAHNNPTVTAVVRTYNRATLVGRAIDSVLAQTFRDFELIVLDDCSSDNTTEVVQAHMEKDQRVRYIRHEKNRGTGRGFNTANDAAKGKYVAYLDDDDVWQPEKLEKQVKKFESCSDRVGFLTGGVQYWNSDTGKKLRAWIPKKTGNVYWEALSESGDIFGPPSVVMIPKKVIDDIGPFREDMPRGCCQQYFRRIAKKYEIDFVEDLVLDYAYHQEAITTITNREDIRKCIVSLQIKIKSTEEDLEKVPKLYGRELTKLGRFQCLYGLFDEGLESFRKATQVKGKSITLAILLLGSKTKSLEIYKRAHWVSGKMENMVRRMRERIGK